MEKVRQLTEFLLNEITGNLPHLLASTAGGEIWYAMASPSKFEAFFQATGEGVWKLRLERDKQETHTLNCVDKGSVYVIDIKGETVVGDPTNVETARKVLKIIGI